MHSGRSGAAFRGKHAGRRPTPGSVPEARESPAAASPPPTARALTLLLPGMFRCEGTFVLMALSLALRMLSN